METKDSQFLSSENLSLIVVHDPLDFHMRGTTTTVIPYRGQTLDQLVSMIAPEHYDVVASIEGKVIPQEEWPLTTPTDGNYIMIMPKYKGDMIRGLLTVAVTILAVIAFVYSAPLMPLYLAAAVAVGISVVGNILINIFCPLNVEDMTPNTDTSISTSPSHSWSPRATQQQGLPLHEVYGRIAVYGNVINVYTQSQESTANLCLAVSFGLGPLKSVSDIRLNKQLTSYYDSVSSTTRLGYIRQQRLPYFHHTATEHSIGQEINYGSAVEYETENANFDSISFDISFPNGLYYANDQGGLTQHSVSITMEFKKEGSSAFIPFRTETFINSTNSAFTRTFTLENCERGKYYTLRFTRNTPDYTYRYGSKSTLSVVRTILNQTFTYPRQPIVAINALATGQLQGSFDFSAIAEGKLIRVYRPDEVIGADGKNYRCIQGHTATAQTRPGQTPPTPDWDEYWVQTGRYGLDNPGAFDATWRLGTSYSATPIWRFEFSKNNAWITYNILTEPVMRDPDTIKGPGDQIYRVIKEHVYATNLYLYEDVGTSNENWKEYLILDAGGIEWQSRELVVGQTYSTFALERYDGMDPLSETSYARIDLESWVDWANHCDELVDDGYGGLECRYEFNGIFDAQGEAWSNAIKVAGETFSTLTWQGSTLFAVIDRPTSPTYMFSSANIVEASDQETFLASSDRAGEIEVTFKDRRNRWQKATASIHNPEYSMYANNKVTLQTVGCDRWSQAWRTARRLLANNRYLKRSGKFSAFMDAIPIRMGDVFYMRRKVLSDPSASGVILEATSNTVTLDTPVTLEAGKSYVLVVKLNVSDAIVTQNVVFSGTVTTDTLTVAQVWTVTPSRWDHYIFGEASNVTRLARCVGLTRKDDLTATVSWIDYDSRCYDDDDKAPSEFNEVSYQPITLSPATNLTASANAYLTQAGIVTCDVTLNWAIPPYGIYGSSRVWYRAIENDEPTTPWLPYQTTPINSIVVSGLKGGVKYEFLVQGMSWTGQALDLSKCPTVLIETPRTVSFPEAFESELTGLRLYGEGGGTSFPGRDCRVVWNPVAVTAFNATIDATPYGMDTPALPLWFAGYEVSILNTDNTPRRTITELLTSPTFTYTYEMNAADGTPVSSFKIAVKAIDYLGSESNTATLTVSNPAPGNIATVLASAIVGGAKFEWARPSDPDLRGYTYRVSIAGQSWGSWQITENNAVVVSLTATQIGLYSPRANIAIEVKAVDVFGQASTVAGAANVNANTIADNLMQIRVSTDAAEGNPSDLYDGTLTSGGVTIR